MPGTKVSAAILLAFIFPSCTMKPKSSESSSFEKSLVESNRIINLSTVERLRALEDKTTKIETAERAKYWFANAEKIQALTEKMYDEIEMYKSRPRREISSQEILQKLVDYKANILAIDSELRSQFSNTLTFNEDYSTIKTQPALTALQNDLKIIENNVVTFCSQKIGSTDHYFYTFFSAIVGQNSNYLKPGETLELKAGIGSFSKAAQPRISFDGKMVEIGEEGYALFKKRVPATPGSYLIPVVITYFDQVTGKDEKRLIDVEYTVAKPCDQ
jgi:hypothetical protein